MDEALAWGRRQTGDPVDIAAAAGDRLAISVGVELLRLVPGYVSTEVDANLSFNVQASVARARQIIDAMMSRLRRGFLSSRRRRARAAFIGVKPASASVAAVGRCVRF